MRGIEIPWEQLRRAVAETELLAVVGKVNRVVGLTIEAVGLNVPVGQLCQIRTAHSLITAEVVGFRERTALLMPLGELEGVGPGNAVLTQGTVHRVVVGEQLLGRVLDGLGNPLDGLPLAVDSWYPVQAAPPHPLERQLIDTPLVTGIKSIDAFTTWGWGQRVGIFAGSGVGKSTMMAMIAKQGNTEVNVIALVGERGREVKEFLTRNLGADGLSRSVVVVATAEQPAMVRVKAPFVATAIAEYFRDQGKNVLLLMDSITRFAMAQREVGLAIGEPPTARGYTPSVFALLPRLLERAGSAKLGSITGLYTVLVDGDDLNEPVADALRGILDGHVVLSRQLAQRNLFPPVDVLKSLSRLMPQVTSAEHRQLADRGRDLLAAYAAAEDLINVGAYQQGSNPRIDAAVRYHDRLDAFLQQGTDEAYSLAQTLQQLKEAVGR